MAASQEALRDSHLVIDDGNRNDISVMVGSGIGGLGTLSEQLKILNEKGPDRVSPFLIPMMISDMAWLAALNAMGAGTTPWSLANLYHTAWSLSTMTPTNSGWVEPEAGGTIAWLLYSAYVQTGNAQYRIGAELAMESLLAYQVSQNPSYELQLPYGAYIAARMNAELGTTYDMVKIVNWCFSDGSDNSRKWGVTVGNWGGYDCDGLIGETGYGSGNGYPFTMNTFEEVGALVPMVRYDPAVCSSDWKMGIECSECSTAFLHELFARRQPGRSWMVPSI